MFATLLFSLALATTQEAERPQEWVITDRGAWGTLALDRASLRRDGELLHYQTLSVPTDGGRMRGEPFAYQIVYWRADCSTQTAGVANSDEFRANGEIVRYEIPIITPMSMPGPLPAGSPIQRLAEGACDGRWNDADAFQSALEVYRAR